jgi:hypothetical protein
VKLDWTRRLWWMVVVLWNFWKIKNARGICTKRYSFWIEGELARKYISGSIFNAIFEFVYSCRERQGTGRAATQSEWMELVLVLVGLLVGPLRCISSQNNQESTTNAKTRKRFPK